MYNIRSNVAPAGKEEPALPPLPPGSRTQTTKASGTEMPVPASPPLPPHQSICMNRVAAAAALAHRVAPPHTCHHIPRSPAVSQPTVNFSSIVLKVLFNWGFCLVVLGCCRFPNCRGLAHTARSPRRAVPHRLRAACCGDPKRNQTCAACGAWTPRCRPGPSSC